MASTELRRPLSLERVESVPADATVRHVDQLDEGTLAAVLSAVENGGPVREAGLEPGEVVVFTDYYRVER